jgi:hypothetical protein
MAFTGDDLIGDGSIGTVDQGTLIHALHGVDLGTSHRSG